MLESIENQQSQKLSSLAKEASQIEGESGFMKPGEKQKPKNKGGRPPLSPEEKARREQERLFKKQNSENTQKQGQQSAPQSDQTIPHIPSSLIAKPFCQGISGLAVAWADDPRASATPDELEAMAQAMGMVLDKWMPQLTSQYGAEMAFVLIFGQYGLRVAALKKVVRLEKEQREKMKAARADIVEETKPQVFEEPKKWSSNSTTTKDEPLSNPIHKAQDFPI